MPGVEQPTDAVTILIRVSPSPEYRISTSLIGVCTKGKGKVTRGDALTGGCAMRKALRRENLTIPPLPKFTGTYLAADH